MTPEQVFSIVNLIALFGWVLLILAPRFAWSRAIVSALPLILSSAYLILLATNWGRSDGGFGSLRDVSQLFQNPWLLLAGWVHYLAFDLFVGSWEAADAAERGLSQWLVVPCLVLTFLVGPVGLLLYSGVRSARPLR
ncbi:MAG TPA: ABA4-like family protein [Bryobacteraceae bacterium]|nr:ABA4-like family protein [Bryobacteraceae bacterium]